MDWSKVAPALALTLAQRGAAGLRVRSFADWPARGTARVLRMRDEGLAQADAAPEQALPVVVCCEDDAVLDAPDGVLWHRTTGRVRTARATADGVAALSELAGVRGVWGSTPVRPLNDLAAAHTHLDLLRQRPPGGLDGQGVVVGIIDTGIDASLPCFAGRIAAVWDQVRTGGTPTGVPYGTVLRGPRVASAFDPDGHGTHVAGIAAAAHPLYGGVAPGATLVVVRTGMKTGEITDAIDFVFAEVAALGLPAVAALSLPAVVNLSLGHHDHAHDGSDPMSMHIDYLSGPGRIVVTSAGNEGQMAIHACCTVVPGAVGSLDFTLQALPGHPVDVLLTAWHDLPGNLACRVLGPDGQALTPWQMVLSTQGPPVRHYGPAGAGCSIALSTSGSSLAGGGAAREVRLVISTPAHVPVVGDGVWHLELHNVGTEPVTVNAWLDDVQEGVACAFVGACVDDGMKVGSPGCAAAAVTVGAVATRTRWTSLAGVHRAHRSLRPSDLCGFSSPGPLRSGAFKPDLVAPGAMIASWASGHATHDSDLVVAADVELDGGTSMSAPFVSGLVALLLQRDGTLGPAEVKAQLRAACAVPGGPPGVWCASWGYGTIDAALLSPRV